MRFQKNVSLAGINLTLRRMTIPHAATSAVAQMWGHPMSSIPEWCNAMMPCLRL